ncbi:RNA polymerase sigma-70 factor [Aliifodinibius sp. S!AR15-10]|uniref:RNA polymerase sigma-70 factor n=1 Tax=Aliifodinibius sp. S!AR15-10 TaxID=2950437 RepID=UPI002858CB3A|nr:RNA polymerase sigma-70 factor [Aliifodinibius sp. S!AR15-10]MDR8393346.1 RNA polymerase sigma-70 factor [Aliifodinibius sp. S!AR15-10]
MGRGSEGELLLIQRIREGEEYAFEITFLKYHTPLCRYLWQYVRSEELAKEIAQEVFADIWENRENLDPSGHLRGFIYEVARNKALNRIKHQEIADQYIAEAREQKKQELYIDKHHEEKNYKDFSGAIEESISNLPPRGRQIFELNRNEGLTYAEISEYLDISIKTVETHMRRTFQKLRDSLSKYVSTVILSGIIWKFLDIIG